MKLAKLYILSLYTCFSSFVSAGTPGSFQQISGSPFAAGTAPASAAYSPLVSENYFAAIPNFNDNTVSVYQVNQSTGTLAQVSGSPFATGGHPAWQAFSPLASGNLFSAVANFNDNTVSVYEVNQTTGVFTPVSGSPFGTGLGPLTVEFSPIVSGNLFAAVPNSGDNTVSVYLVNQLTGAFTPVLGSPFATGTAPNFASFSPIVTGNLFAAVANLNDNTVSVNIVNQTTGTFTAVPSSPFATGLMPYSVRFSPLASGNLFATVVNLNSNSLSVYKVDQTTGNFMEIPSSPFAAGTGPNEIAFSPIVSGHLFAAVVNFNSNNVSVYDVNQATGIFTQVIGSPFASGGGPDGIAFSPFVSGNLFAAVANFFDNTVSVYQVTTQLPPTPPSNLQGFQKANKFLSQTEYYNVLRWSPPLTGAPIVAYKIFRDSPHSKLLGVVSNQQPLKFIDHNCRKGITYAYSIVSIDAFGNVSQPAIVSVNGIKSH